MKLKKKFRLFLCSFFRLVLLKKIVEELVCCCLLLLYFCVFVIFHVSFTAKKSYAPGPHGDFIISKGSSPAYYIVVLFTFNRSFYPTALAISPVSFLILNPRRVIQNSRRALNSVLWAIRRIDTSIFANRTIYN